MSATLPWLSLEQSVLNKFLYGNHRIYVSPDVIGPAGIICYFLIKRLVGKIASDNFEAVVSIFAFSLICHVFADLAQPLVKLRLH